MITNKVKRPEDYCTAYLAGTYGSFPISKTQAKEISLAFHAGMEATCKFIHRYIAGQEGVEDEILINRLVRFRERNRQRAIQINQLQQPQPANK